MNALVKTPAACPDCFALWLTMSGRPVFFFLANEVWGALSFLAMKLYMCNFTRGAVSSGWLKEAESKEGEEDPFQLVVGTLMGPIHDANSLFSLGLNNYCLCTMYSLFDDNLGFWMRPRSTTWFSRFLLEQYDDQRWVQMFRMSKKSVFVLADLLRIHVEHHDTKYKVVIPVVIRVACTLFKLTHGASLIICSEMFAIGKSIVSMMLHDVVHAINESMRNEITWPTGDRLRQCQVDFKRLSRLPAVVGAIDGTHVSISKPKHVLADYYYLKSGGYTLNCQAVVDSEKQFLDLFLGMPSSTNDSHMLRRSSLHHLAMHNNLFDRHNVVKGFSSFLIGDSGYPLLSWAVVDGTTSRARAIECR